MDEILGSISLNYILKVSIVVWFDGQPVVFFACFFAGLKGPVFAFSIELCII